MFGKKNKKIARLTEELAAATASFAEMHTEYEVKLSNAKDDINAREDTITAQKAEISNLKKSLADSEDALRKAAGARDIIASQLTNEGTLRTNAESALSASRRGEDQETDAFYAAKFASAKAESESKAVEDTITPETVAQTSEEPKEVSRQVTRNTRRKH